MKLLALACAAFLLPAPAFCADHQFENGETVSIQPDKAYVLVRTFSRPGGALRGTVRFTPILIRVLGADELDQAKALAEKDRDHWQENIESNVVEPLPDHPYAEENGEDTLLTSLKPGTYIVGGLAVANWISVSSGVLTTSLCMGTVRFDAKPGVITDLGAIVSALDNEPTDIPELSKLVTGKTIGDGVIPYIVAIRPDIASQSVPAAIGALPRIAADYRATGAFPNYLGAPLSRLAPLAGVLAYDRDGQAIDLKAAGATNR